MKTTHAVLLSTGIVLVAGGALAALGYTAYRKIESATLPHTANVSAPPTSSSGACQARAKRALASVADAWKATSRPVLNIELVAMAQDDVRVSKVGGQAFWAKGRDYPRDAGGRPMYLLAQIDFASAPKLDGYPQQGLLQFFIAADAFYGAHLDHDAGASRMKALAKQTNFRVVYWPSMTGVEAVSPPAGTQLSEAPLPFDPAQPRRMTWSEGRETMGANDAAIGRVLGEAPDVLADRYARDVGEPSEEVQDEVAELMARGGHKIGGYPDFTQADPRAADDAHRLLLQLDSDEAMMWGDSGIANFFIDPADLARADFSRVAYHWDCY